MMWVQSNHMSPQKWRISLAGTRREIMQKRQKREVAKRAVRNSKCEIDAMRHCWFQDGELDKD